MPQYIGITTGYLRTFLLGVLPTGLTFAVVDRKARANEPDVLFASDGASELIEHFTDDIDNQKVVAQAIRYATPSRFDKISTRYRAKPVRLGIVRLDPELDWVLVTIQDRNQSGYGIWRNAVAGYAAWTIAVLLAGLSGLVFLAFRPEGVDRKPSMWLWPHRVLVEWPSQFRCDAATRQQLRWARQFYNCRVLCGSGYLLAVVVTPEPARLLMALTAVVLVSSARGAFLGRLGADLKSARRVDRWTAWVGMAIAVLTLLADIGITGLSWYLHQIRLDAFRISRAILSAAFTLIAILVFRADCADWRAAARSGPAAGRPTKLRRWFRRNGARTAVLFDRSAWAVALMVAAIAPATAGFLDSYAANAAWSREVDRWTQCDFARETRERILAIDRTLAPKDAIPLPIDDPRQPTTCPPKESPTEVTWLTVGVSLLGLKPEAMRYSRSLPSSWWWPTFWADLAAVLPFLALIGALSLFRRQYFRDPPAPATPSPNLHSETLIRKILDVAQEARRLTGNSPTLPQRPLFTESFVQRHLIVGAGLDNQQDPRLREPHSPARRYDLLRDDGPIANPKDFGAVVIYNFDAALLKLKTYQLALDRLEALAKQQITDDGRHLHLFLFAASEPLDRILSTEMYRQGDIGSASADDGVTPELRWAELLDTFSLYNVARNVPQGATLFERELSVVGSSAASLLLKRKQDWDQMDNQKLIAFLTDFLADHYSLIWETSSPDERVILYEIARGSHLKMNDSFALRSLMLRRLVVRAPEYRLMNQSFTRYVQNVGRPATLRAAANAAKDGTDKIWPALRLPVALLVASGLVLLILVTPGESGLTTVVPALAAAVPALISAWLRGSRPAAD